MGANRRDVDFSDIWIGSYHFKKLLGRGGYASVWLADECKPNRGVIRSVAIKIFVDDFADRSSFQKTFDNFELDLTFLAQLSPNNPIIQYFTWRMVDIFVDPSGIPRTIDSRTPPEETADIALTALLLVMEYADGGHLGPAYRDEVIVRGDDTSYLDHFMDICKGLRAAHKKEIIHRDIKPQNLLWFRKDNRIKIGDFGIAKHMNEARPGGLYLVGAFPYMAPECFQPNIFPRPERDIYALGCTFYELFTASRAFDLPPTVSVTPDTLPQIIEAYRAQHEEAPRPEAVIKAPELISIELSGVIRCMMDVRPDDRPSLEEVIEALGKEKSRSFGRTRVSDTADAPKLPLKPVYKSTHNVNPVFRKEFLKEAAFFVFINMPMRTQHKYRTLGGLLKAYFGDTYSICEVFGRYDFLVRVWSAATRIHIREFCKNVSDQILDADKNALHIMACEDVSYIGAAMRPLPKDLVIMKALVNLNEAQSRESEEAAKWLEQNRVYVRRLGNSVDGSKVKCFCLVAQGAGLSEAEREAHGELIIRTIEKSERINAKKHAISVYRKAYQPVEGFENEPSDYVIKYVAPTFDEVIELPAIILDEISKQRFQTTTLLATKRYFVESDRVVPR